MHVRPSFRWIWLGAALAALMGCGDAPRAPGSQDADSGTHLVWQGVIACADCAGIDTRLWLDQGTQPHYQLVEAFMDGQEAQYFREEGRWERSGARLVLHAQAGGVRRYRIGPDGSLVATDHAGREGAGGMLVPAAGPQQGM